jgi:hypothetical protein
MKKITEYVGRLCSLVGLPQAEQAATAPKFTTSPANALRILMPLDKLWLEATQLSLPLDAELPTSSKVCSGQLWYTLWETPSSLPTGQESKLELTPGFPIPTPVFRSYRFLSEGRTSIKLTQAQPSTSLSLTLTVNSGKSEKSKS